MRAHPMKSALRICAAAALLVAPNMLANPATAQDNSAQDSPFVAFRVLKPELALAMAKTALETCRDNGYQVRVTVVDRFGIPQVFLRDRFAGLHVYETSRRKAWTAVAFRTSTGDLGESTRAGEPSAAIRQLSEALPLRGGLVVQSGDGSIVAGIGVSGAPGGKLDEDCARAGIAVIEEEISF